jgi:hypothetical protein
MKMASINEEREIVLKAVKTKKYRISESYRRRNVRENNQRNVFVNNIGVGSNGSVISGEKRRKKTAQLSAKLKENQSCSWRVNKTKEGAKSSINWRRRLA